MKLESVPPVSELLRRVGVTATDARVERMLHNRWLTPGAWRVTDDLARPMLLKYLRDDRPHGATPWEAHWTEGDADPEHWNYWPREALAYEAFVTDAFAPAGIKAPECFGVEITDHDAIVLLEWVDGRPGESWPVAAYGPLAEQLGAAQGSIQTEHAIPELPWLSRRFLREYGSEKPVSYELLNDDRAWDHPLARAVFPAGLREAVNVLHDNRQRLLQINESLPQTLCHLDLWPKNLIQRPSGDAVLFDWAFVGVGAIGEDAGNLVPDSCFDHFIHAEQLAELEQVVFDGYLSGLRAGGWNEDARLVQLGMWSSAVKYDWLAPLTLQQLNDEHQYSYGGAERIDAEFKFRERSRALLFNARWAQRAIELADQLGL